jgi:anthranilate synthase component 1
VTHFVSSVPVIDGAEVAAQLLQAEDDVRTMVRLAGETASRSAESWRVGELNSDTDEDTFCRNVEAIRKDIHNGRFFQAVYGRTISTPFDGNPFDVYCRLSRLNPSPYMFYVHDRDGALLAASPEMAVRVTRRNDEMRVEVRPIAGTKPRGIVDGRIDPLLDAKYEATLKIDPKELAEHTMLVDLARNDVSSVCRAGTTIVDEPFVIEKYSHVQHLVSNVSGTLREDLDALHVYLATMNMGTVTGAPKLEAMKIINELEASARGFFGGSVGYVTPDGEMDTALVIRAIRFKDGRAHVRAAAGIVADSVPRSEWAETATKAEACLRCLREGGESGA